MLTIYISRGDTAFTTMMDTRLTEVELRGIRLSDTQVGYRFKTEPPLQKGDKFLDRFDDEVYVVAQAWSMWDEKPGYGQAVIANQLKAAE